MNTFLMGVACVLGTICGLAQGTVQFNNSPAAIGGTGARVVFPDGTGVGAGWVAQLYGGPVGGALTPVGVPLPFRTTEAGLGFINTTGVDTTREIRSVAPGAPADVEVRAWATVVGATYEAALASGTYYGASPTLTVPVTGGAGSPPSLPVPLIGLQGFAVIIPEPSIVALEMLAIGALWLRYRARVTCGKG